MTTTYIATLPRSIYIEPTSRCNELCQQCPRTLLSREDDRVHDLRQFIHFANEGKIRSHLEEEQIDEASCLFFS